MALISSGGEQRISFIVSFTVLTLLFQRSNFCGNFITFLEVLKLLITNYSVMFLSAETFDLLFILDLQPIKEFVSVENDAPGSCY